jgi:DNA-3-methyladenine glycosylase
VVARTLPRRFFARDADLVARDLLGRVLVHQTTRGRLAARIVETEAYFGPAGRNPHLAERSDMPTPLRARLLREGDPASHSFRGPTTRSSVMFGPPGFWYVYLIYGMHECANVVTGPERDPEPQAVLLRAGEPLEGADEMRRRRKGRLDLSGPAKLCQALGVTRAHYGLPATEPPLWFEAGERVDDRDVLTTPRVGITSAADLPLRFVVKGEKASRRGGVKA